MVLKAPLVRWLKCSSFFAQAERPYDNFNGDDFHINPDQNNFRYYLHFLWAFFFIIKKHVVCHKKCHLKSFIRMLPV